MIRNFSTCLLALFIFTSAAVQATAQVRIEDLSWLQQRKLENQVRQIDDLARLQLGQPVRGNADDLELLQRIIHGGLIQQKDVNALQALGAVLGNVLVAELQLQWKSYEDDLGTSRAACIPDTSECLFPITMLSRRMEVGLMPDVRRIYGESKDLVDSYRQKIKTLYPNR